MGPQEALFPKKHRYKMLGSICEMRVYQAHFAQPYSRNLRCCRARSSDRLLCGIRGSLLLGVLFHCVLLWYPLPACSATGGNGDASEGGSGSANSAADMRSVAPTGSSSLLTPSVPAPRQARKPSSGQSGPMGSALLSYSLPSKRKHEASSDVSAGKQHPHGAAKREDSLATAQDAGAKGDAGDDEQRRASLSSSASASSQRGAGIVSTTGSASAPSSVAGLSVPPSAPGSLLPNPSGPTGSFAHRIQGTSMRSTRLPRSRKILLPGIYVSSAGAARPSTASTQLPLLVTRTESAGLRKVAPRKRKGADRTLTQQSVSCQGGRRNDTSDGRPQSLLKEAISSISSSVVTGNAAVGCEHGTGSSPSAGLVSGSSSMQTAPTCTGSGGPEVSTRPAPPNRVTRKGRPGRKPKFTLSKYKRFAAESADQKWLPEMFTVSDSEGDPGVGTSQGISDSLWDTEDGPADRERRRVVCAPCDPASQAQGSGTSSSSTPVLSVPSGLSQASTASSSVLAPSYGSAHPSSGGALAPRTAAAVDAFCCRTASNTAKEEPWQVQSSSEDGVTGAAVNASCCRAASNIVEETLSQVQSFFEDRVTEGGLPLPASGSGFELEPGTEDALELAGFTCEIARKLLDGMRELENVQRACLENMLNALETAKRSATCTAALQTEVENVVKLLHTRGACVGSGHGGEHPPAKRLKEIGAAEEGQLTDTEYPIPGFEGRFAPHAYQPSTSMSQVGRAYGSQAEGLDMVFPYQCARVASRNASEACTASIAAHFSSSDPVRRPFARTASALEIQTPGSGGPRSPTPALLTPLDLSLASSASSPAPTPPHASAHSPAGHLRSTGSRGHRMGLAYLSSPVIEGLSGYDAGLWDFETGGDGVRQHAAAAPSTPSPLSVTAGVTSGQEGLRPTAAGQHHSTGRTSKSTPAAQDSAGLAFALGGVSAAHHTVPVEAVVSIEPSLSEPGNRGRPLLSAVGVRTGASGDTVSVPSSRSHLVLSPPRDPAGARRYPVGPQQPGGPSAGSAGVEDSSDCDWCGRYESAAPFSSPYSQMRPWVVFPLEPPTPYAPFRHRVSGVIRPVPRYASQGVAPPLWDSSRDAVASAGARYGGGNGGTPHVSVRRPAWSLWLPGAGGPSSLHLLPPAAPHPDFPGPLERARADFTASLASQQQALDLSVAAQRRVQGDDPVTHGDNTPQ